MTTAIIDPLSSVTKYEYNLYSSLNIPKEDTLRMYFLVTASPKGYVPEEDIPETLRKRVLKTVDKVNPKSFVKKSKNNQKRIESKIRKEYGDKIDVNKLKKKSRSAGKKIANTLNSIKSRAQKAPTKDFVNYIIEIYSSVLRFENALIAIPLSIMLMIIVFILNTILNIAFTVMTGNPLLGVILTSSIAAPLTEETAKRFSYLAGFGNQYSVYFPVAELILYMFKAPLFGVSLLSMFLIRVGVMFGHQYWSMLHKEDKETGSMKGYRNAIILHALWNSGLFAVPTIVYHFFMKKRSKLKEKEPKVTMPSPAPAPAPA